MKTERLKSFPLLDLQGFTLLEVMVALAMLSIVLTGIYRLHGQTISMAHASRFYVTAPLLAQSKLSELQAFSDTDLLDGSGDFGERFPGYTWKITSKEMESEILGGEAENLKQVDVTVSLMDIRTYSVRTYRFITPEK